MKTNQIVLSLVAACLLCSCATGVKKSNVRYGPIGVAPVRTSVTEAQTITSKVRVRVRSASDNALLATGNTAKLKAVVINNPEAYELVLKLEHDLDTLTKDLTGANMLITDLENQLNATHARINELEQKDIERSVEMNKINDERNAAIAERDKANHAYHQLKLGVCVLAALLTVGVFFAIFSVAAFAPPLVYATAGLPVLIFGLLWWRL